MANVFATKDNVVLKGNGYLVVNEGGKEVPVNHDEFVKLQKEANVLVRLAAKVKETDFTVKKVKTFQQVQDEVTKELQSESKKYVTVPTSVERPVTDSLAKEALAWINFEQEGTKAEKINKIMSKFDTLDEFSNFGLYFTTDKIVKLPKIYSIEEVLAAVTVLEPHLTA